MMEIQIEAPVSALERRLLAALPASSFGEVEADAMRMQAVGRFVGRLIEVRDSRGMIVNYRPYPYASAIEARVDGILEEAERHVEECEGVARAFLDAARIDPTSPQISAARADVDRARARRDELRDLAPLGRRWTLRRDLAAAKAEFDRLVPRRAASIVTVGERRSDGRHPMFADPASEALHAFNMREAERARSRRGRDPLDDAVGAITRIELALRDWDRDHPTLVRALAEDRGW